MRLALPLILLPLLTWAMQQSSPSPAETLDVVPPPSESSPRAALVALVEESDLSDLGVSIRQLEESFNARFQYPWVFFSTKPLNEDFREVVSAATTSACFYEVITPCNHSLNESHDLASPAHCHRCPAHHSLDFLAKQGRMRDYDWFWRVEPGVSAFLFHLRSLSLGTFFLSHVFPLHLLSLAPFTPYPLPLTPYTSTDVNGIPQSPFYLGLTLWLITGTLHRTH